MTEANQLPDGAFTKLALRKPIEREGGKITELALMEPGAPALLDLSLMDLVRMRADAVVKILPRISVPSITPAEAMMLGGSDLFALSNRLSDFLLLSESG